MSEAKKARSSFLAGQGAHVEFASFDDAADWIRALRLTLSSPSEEGNWVYRTVGPKDTTPPQWGSMLGHEREKWLGWLGVCSDGAVFVYLYRDKSLVFKNEKEALARYNKAGKTLVVAKLGAAITAMVYGALSAESLAAQKTLLAASEALTRAYLAAGHQGFLRTRKLKLF